MANKIQIKRGTVCSSALAEGELGYNLSKNILYIGNNGNKAIGGSGAFLPLSGGTLTGPLTTTQLTVNRSDNDYPTITFIPKSRSPLNSSFIQTNTNGTFGFYSYHSDQDTDDDAGRYYTGYTLPGPTAGLNSGNVENGKGITYEILTEKKAVTVAQGGTGQDMAETPANALIRMSSAGTFWYTASANGAVYATSANGAITFGTLPVAQGGTNATNVSDARKNLGAFGSIGTNPVTTTATDTTTTWKDKGLGYAWYSQSGQLNNQPSTYGFLLNYVNNGDIFQIWRAQSGGPTHWRSGNGSGWGNTWAKVYDELNKPTASELGVLPLAGGTMTGTITLAATGFKTPNSGGYYTNQHGNFVHQVNNANQTWNICNNAGASKFAVDFESGYVTVKGLVNGTPISQNWILTSRSGAFRVETAATGSAAAAALSMKVKDGSWAIANLATSSSLYFVFGSDENYNAGTNKSSTYYITPEGLFSGYINWSNVKNPLVTIAQGGTEATSVLGAQANLLTTDSSKITATTNLNTILQTGRFKMEGNASTTYNWPADASGARCLVIQEGALNSGTYGYWKQTAHMLGQHRTYSRNYHWDHWMEWKMDYNEETLVYSTSQPVNGYKGRIWLKPI